MGGPRCVVVGGYVLDCLVTTSELPAWGKDTQAVSIGTAPGGKAFNQAVVLARRGAATEAVGAVGNDAAGQTVVEALERDGVDVSAMVVHETAPTATIVVLTRPDGANAIVAHVPDEVAVSAAMVDRVAPSIRAADAVLLTFETAPEGLERAIHTARAAQTLVVVNAAGAAPDAYADVPWSEVDVLVANEEEARGLLGVGAEASATELAGALGRRLGCRFVCVTLGAQGCRTWNGTEARTYPARPVSAADTTAAGDTFTATLTERLAGGADEQVAVTTALNAAAETVSRPGGYDSLPRRYVAARLGSAPPSAAGVTPLLRAHEALAMEVLALGVRAATLAKAAEDPDPPPDWDGVDVTPLTEIHAVARGLEAELGRWYDAFLGWPARPEVGSVVAGIAHYLDGLAVMEGARVPQIEAGLAQVTRSATRHGSPTAGEGAVVELGHLRRHLDNVSERLALAAAHGIQLSLVLTA